MRKEVNYGMDICNLSIIASGTCNLSCRYCFLCGLNKFKKFDEEVVNGLKDGTYLSNCITTLRKMGSRLDRITKLAMWGGECTIHAKLWATYIHEWLDSFPNVKNITFISNGVFNPQDVGDWYGEINKWAKDNDTTIEVFMQVSIDGDEFYNKDRGSSPQKIQSNCIELLNLCVDKHYHNIDPQIKYKSTYDVDLYNKICETRDSCESYWEWWHSYIKETIDNLKVKHRAEYLLANPILTMLYDYTQEQGINLAKSLYVQESINWQGLSDKYKIGNLLRSACLIDGVVGNMSSTNRLSDSGWCSQYTYEVMVRPDGSVVGCLCGLYNDKDEYREYAKEHDIEEYNNCLRVPDRYFLNVPEMNPTDINSFLKMWKDFAQSYKTLLSANCALIYELAWCNQVDKSYLNDSSKLIRHASLMTGKTSCVYNSLRKTGDPFVSTLGQARLYCNGVFDYFDKLRKGESVKYEVARASM